MHASLAHCPQQPGVELRPVRAGRKYFTGKQRATAEPGGRAEHLRPRQLDIGDAWLAACPDYGVRAAASDPKLVAYFRDEVGVQEVSRYVNDGVMLLNIRAMNRLL